MRSDEKDLILREAHCGIAGGHYVGEATAQKIWQSGLWWPTTLKDAVKYSRECNLCQRLGQPTEQAECHGKPVLLFQTRMGNMPGKLRFRWTGPFWITKEYNASYQLGTLSGEVIGKWANGFRLKPYKGHMPANPFQQDPEIRHDEEPTPTDAAAEIRSEEEPTPIPTKTTPEN